MIPSSQFGNQELDTGAEIVEFVNEHYGLTPLDDSDEGTPGFYILEKMDVNGKKTHGLYKYLKSYFNGKVAWNFFTTFVVDRNGIPHERLDNKPWAAIEGTISKLLGIEHEEDKLTRAHTTKSWKPTAEDMAAGDPQRRGSF